MNFRLIIILLLFVSACSSKNRKHDKVLPPEKMQSVLWDVIEADVYIFTKRDKDSSFNRPRENATLQESIFRKHGISREVYYNSLDYYLTNSETFVPMLDSVMAHHPAQVPSKRKRERLDTLRLQVQ